MPYDGLTLGDSDLGINFFTPEPDVTPAPDVTPDGTPTRRSKGSGRQNIFSDYDQALYEGVNPDQFSTNLGVESDGMMDKYQALGTGEFGNYYGDTDLTRKEIKDRFYENQGDIIKTIDGFDYYNPEGDHWLEWQKKFETKRYNYAKENNIDYEPYFTMPTVDEFIDLLPWAAEIDRDKLKRLLDKKRKPGSKIDGKHGEYSSNANNWKLRKPIVDIEDEIDRDTKRLDLKPGEFNSVDNYEYQDSDWWMQDLLKLNAINNRKRKAFLPYQPVADRIDLDVVLEDPTRAIAAINEQLGIQTQAAGAFAGPQSLAARTAQAQGKAATAIANEIGRVNQRNVSTINRGNIIQGRYDALINRENRDRTVKEYDDTTKVLQMYMDEQNFDNEQYSDALANAVTNRAYTYNLNSLQDYYKIDPMSGGMIGQFSEKAFDPQPIPGRFDFIRPFAEVSKQYAAATGKAPNEAQLNALMKMYNQNLTRSQTPQQTNAQAAYFNPNNAPLPFQPQYKKGAETKKWASPFYVGKTI